ncbi:MAG: tetratricopeptide repeat protein [Bacteroidota bacterium]
MRFKGLAILAGLLLFSATLFSQTTIADVINKFNDGVAKLNAQEYDVAIGVFNETLSMCEQVGAEADDMKAQAQTQIPSTYYRQAALWMKRKQYDKAIPYLENTVKYATEYNNNQEYAEKSQQFLQSLYIMEGNKSVAAVKYSEALDFYDKALALNPDLPKAHQGKGIVYLKQEDTGKMLSEFNLTKDLAGKKGDNELIKEINTTIDNYFNPMIFEALQNVDEEDQDYSDVVDACEQAIDANETNPTAYYVLCLVNNKEIEYDAAIEYGEKAATYETDENKLALINFELGVAYQATVQYEKACEAFNKAMVGDLIEKVEKKKLNVPGCN